MLPLGILAALAAAAWVFLLLGHGGFWRTDQRLPRNDRLPRNGHSPGNDPQSPGQPDQAAQPGPPGWPGVVAVVPARDEAAILPVTLPTLLGQDYPGPFAITLVDDDSSDGTAEVAARLGAGSARSLRVVRGASRPAGWAGKPWAMAQGFDAIRAGGTPDNLAAPLSPGAAPSALAPSDLSAPASAPAAPPAPSGPALAPAPSAPPALSGPALAPAPSAPSAPSGPALAPAPSAPPAPSGFAPASTYVLFTDADIAWGPAALRDLVSAAESGRRDLVSQMVLLRTETGWERAVIPAFVYFFAQLYPFRRVNRPGGRTAAAAGGCMLVRRHALEAAGGLAPIRGALIDDVALGRLLKRPPARGRCWLGLTTDIRSVRPYRGLADLWDMIARSAYTQLRYSPLLLAGTILGLAWLYALPPAAAIAGLAAGAGTGASGAAATGSVLCTAAGLAGWAVMTASFVPMLRLYRLSPLRAPALPLIALMYAGMTADSARRHYAGRGGAWKGRAGQTGSTGRPGPRATEIPEDARG